ncbi:hypothetical protein SAMN04488012_10858 [Palleronia salina]|uniref:Uncharacterized protein n=1 Tax=Palleronia salina TaxID=313368 RepID=A0A1M6IPC2_9RHOB|nr:hypothetical protein [Palleronia salina]SHJ36290.1 hypothetical protein SAMN04488012_10858 [Palleronia salina]
MTVLSEYARLEASGLWRESPESQRRDVVVSIGDATLKITDMSDRPLAHWSLPAVERRNPGAVPALFAPGPDAGETLELDDSDMISAIERVQRAVERRRPRRGWLRTGVLAVVLAGLLAGGVLWLPDALVRHATAVVPEAVRADTGRRLLAQITRVAGEPCANPAARSALAQLSSRVLGPGSGRLVVLPGGPETAAHLPGRLILLNRALIEDYEAAEPVAGYILAELARAEIRDPMARLLEFAGPMAAVQLLTRGEVPDDTLRRYAEHLSTSPRAPLPVATFLSRMSQAQIPVAPYAYAEDITGETTVALIEADPVTPETARPVLTDGQWVALQNICAR